MAYLDDLQLWHFIGQPAARLLSSTSNWEEWFDEETILSIEPILDTQERYIDIGGTSYGALQLTLAFPDAAARSAFMALRGIPGTLTRPGRAGVAVMRRCQPIASGHNGFVLLNCTFEAL